MKSIQSTYTATAAEAQNAILDWVRATEEFHQHYFGINQAINGLSYGAHPRTTDHCPRRVKVQHLLKLRQYMCDVLTTLLSDMDTPTAKRRRISSSKPGQLVSHTRLLQEINRKVVNELAQLTAPQA